MAINEFYVPDQREEILRARGLGNFANTNQMISQADVSQNSTMRAVPATYGQQSNYIARQATPMAAPSEAEVRAMFNDMRTNPDNYTNEDIEFAKNLYKQMFGGNLFSNDAVRAGKNALFDFADTLAFGLIPDALGPQKLSTADEYAGMAGSAGAFFMPGVGPMATAGKFASKAVPALGKFAGRFGSKAAGEGVKLPGMLSKLLGKETVDLSLQGILNSPKVAARVGGAIGGGFNFEEGINPTGAMLGAMFPLYAKKGNPAAGSADEVIGATDDAMRAEEMIRGNRLLPQRASRPRPVSTVSYKDNIDDIVNQNNAYATNLYNEGGMRARAVPRQANIPGLDAQGVKIPPKTKTEMTIAIQDELATAKENLSAIAQTNPEYAKYIQQLDQLWSTSSGRNEIINQAMKNMQSISPEFGSKLDDIWGVSSSLLR